MMIYFLPHADILFSERYSRRDLHENSNSSRHTAAVAAAAAATATLQHQRLTLFILGWTSGVITINRRCYFIILALSNKIFASSKPTSFYQAKPIFARILTFHVPTIINVHFKRINCQFYFTPLNHFPM